MPDRKDDQIKPVVVGIDGSAGSRQALAVAAKIARAMGCPLRMIGVDDTAADAWLMAYGDTKYDYEERRNAFRRMVHNAVRETLGDAADAGDVTVEIAAGVPATVLLQEAAGAEMLVVGSRGHGRFVGLALGSVSQRCFLHSTRPVLVVPSVAPARSETSEEHDGQRSVLSAPLY